MEKGIEKEVKYRTSRSGGAGGQHVNKVSTKVELLFDIEVSEVLSEREKIIVREKLANKISQEDVLSLKCDETRSQLTNKEIVFKRFLNLLNSAFAPVKKRKATKPTKLSVKKRLNDKKKQSQKKSNRRFSGE